MNWEYAVIAWVSVIVGCLIANVTIYFVRRRLNR